MKPHYDVCWCGAAPLPGRATCSAEHARLAPKQRPRSARMCFCGKVALPKRATCSDDCAKARAGSHRKNPPKECVVCGGPFTRNGTTCGAECAKQRSAARAPKCPCGKVRPQGRRYCSDSCMRSAVEGQSKARSVGQRSESRRAVRRRQKATAYKGRDKAEVCARLTQEQGSLCAICKQSDGLVLDHCHVSGKPRAMLCVRCNAALGLVREDPCVAEALKEYAQACEILKQSCM